MIKDNKLEPVAEVGSTYTLLWARSETISAIHERSGVKVGSMLVTVDQAEAYTAARVRQAQAWQPIETAPKDGTVIDLWVDGFRVPDCKFAEGNWVYWSEYGDYSYNPGFYILYQDGAYPNNASPTHWRPIPPPPGDAE